MTYAPKHKALTHALFALTAITLPLFSQFARAADIDTSELKLKVDLAFPDVKWPSWDSGAESGKTNPLRPILVAHSNDSKNRIFVPTQQGVIYVLPNDQKATDAKVFLDITEKVVYDDKQNEEGFLGLTFHPKFRENGYFFVYYTNKAKAHQNILARYQADKDHPDQALPGSEEILITFDKPFWNHDGGSLAFGPDGYLYVSIGDGGSGNDPMGNGQNVNTLLGKILRLDVDHRDAGRNYSIPTDNPLVDRKDAKPEIYAYGLRNPWRMSFDSKTGELWAADVGQDTYEEIDLIVRGGNYGWNTREGLHAFVARPPMPTNKVIDAKTPAEIKAAEDAARAVADKEFKALQAKADETPKPAGMIDPIFEYNHDVGKSITGGFVYRGKNIRELDGAYLYADYVAGKLWALRYDADKKRVTANRPIPLPWNIPVMSFGEDDEHEIYLTTYAQTGKGIYRIGK